MNIEKIIEIRKSAYKELYEDQVGWWVGYLDKMELSMMCWIANVDLPDNQYENWQVHQFCRAICVFRSCKILISQGAATDALALSRTIQDIYVLSSYVAADKEQNFKKIAADVERENVFSAQRMVDNNVPDLDQNVRQSKQKNAHKMDKLPSVKQMAQEVGLHDLYATLYPMSSAYLHGHGSEVAFTAIQQGSIVVTPTLFPSSENVIPAWLSLFLIMKDYWRAFSKWFNIDIDYDWKPILMLSNMIMEQNYSMHKRFLVVE